MIMVTTSCTLNSTVLQALFGTGGSQTAATSTPTPSAPERINFAPGTNSAQLVGQVDENSFHTYLLAAVAGQRMQARVASPYNNVYLTVVSPFGSPLARAQAGAQSFDGILPETGDYTLQVSAPAGTALTTYLLNVTVTTPTPTPLPPTAVPGYQRIHFAPGAVSAQVNGQVDGTGFDGYLLEAHAGQRMQIILSSPTGNVFLTVVSPFGSPLARAQNGVQSFDQILPETGDYRLEVSAPAGTPLTNYTLTVVVTGGSPTLTPSIAPTFTRRRSRATSASISRRARLRRRSTGRSTAARPSASCWRRAPGSG